MANEGELGTVSELARAWRLEGRLRRAMIYGDALDRCLDCKVEASDRAKTVAGSAFMRERRIVLNAALFKPGRERTATPHSCTNVPTSSPTCTSGAIVAMASVGVGSWRPWANRRIAVIRSAICRPRRTPSSLGSVAAVGRSTTSCAGRAGGPRTAGAPSAARVRASSRCTGRPRRRRAPRSPGASDRVARAPDTTASLVRPPS